MIKRSFYLYLIFFILLLTACADNHSEEPVDSRFEDINAIPIETISSTEATDSVSEHVVETSYSPADCNFDHDAVNHRINARYDDTANNPDGYIIDYDLTYYEYDADQVAIYTTEGERERVIRRFSLTDSLWVNVLPYWPGALKTWSNDILRQESIYESALAYSVTDLSSYDLGILLENLEEEYDVFPYAFIYPYPVKTMNDTNEPDERFGLLTPDNERTIGFVASDDLKYITLRNSLDGIPIGVPYDNRTIMNRIYYGDLYGSINNAQVEDDYYHDYYNSSEELLVDFVYYNYLPDQSNVEYVDYIPLDECIQNSISGVLLFADRYSDHYCRVYAAELLYYPFQVGCEGTDDWSFDVNYVPVWALYVASYGSGMMYQAEVSVVYLNAINGELFGYAL